MENPMNTQGTDGDSVTVGLPEPEFQSREQKAAVANSYLTRLRNTHGAESTIGRLCSKLMEQLDNLPPGPEDRIEYLTSDATKAQRANLLKSIEFSERDLYRAMQAAQ